MRILDMLNKGGWEHNSFAEIAIFIVWSNERKIEMLKAMMSGSTSMEYTNEVAEKLCKKMSPWFNTVDSDIPALSDDDIKALNMDWVIK